MAPDELHIFARFQARPGSEKDTEHAIRDVLRATREELGCMEIHAFRSTRDKRLFCIQSRWANEAAFDLHAELPHTIRFIERVEALVDQPIEVTRSSLLDL